MARPDIKIGEEVFHPLKRNFLGNTAANVEYAAAILLADYLYPNRRQYEEAALLWKVLIFYGRDAGKVYEEAMKPRVRTTTEITTANQGINISRYPTISTIENSIP